jgi:hypothetical protein
MEDRCRLAGHMLADKQVEAARVVDTVENMLARSLQQCRELGDRGGHDEHCVRRSCGDDDDSRSREDKASGTNQPTSRFQRDRM